VKSELRITFTKIIILLFPITITVLLMILGSYDASLKVMKNDKTQPRLIVSITSFPERFPRLIECLQTIKQQTIKPDKIILYLSNQECKEEIPKAIQNFVDIHWVENILKENSDKIEWDGQIIRSYGKLIPALLEYPDDNIITFDDDREYDKRCIEHLVFTHKRYPKDIINLGGRNIDFSEIKNKYDEGYYIFEGGTGLLYPPHCFIDKDIFNLNLATKEFATTDDIFFWRCALLNHTKTINPFGKICYKLYETCDTPGVKNLSAINFQNDAQVNKENINKVFKLNPNLVDLFSKS
jgi:hypothetical protein